jgi:hypothetical protein
VLLLSDVPDWRGNLGLGLALAISANASQDAVLDLIGFKHWPGVLIFRPFLG